MKNKFKILAILLIIIIVLLIILIPKVNNKINQVCFKSACINVVLALSQEQQEQGLMFQENLSGGMLFIYDSEKNLSFWMKNTLISLDIIWINSDLEIAAIEQAYPCSDSCEIYTHSARYVLEVNSNFTIENNIKLNDKVELKS